MGQASSGVNGLWGIAMSAANPVYLPMSIIRPQPQPGNFISNSYKAMGGRAGGSYKAGRVTGTVGSALVPLGGWASAGSRAAASGAAKAGSAGRGFVKSVQTAARKCSFAGLTVVLMADGTRKSIEDIEVGDLVMADRPRDR